MTTTKWILCSLLGLASTPVLACYTVFDRADNVVYQSSRPPVDMSRPLHETLPAVFPGGHMIFDAGSECPVISSVASGQRSSAGASPLLTDQRTAQAMNVPYKAMPGGIALVSPRDAVMMPGVTVLPSQTAVAARPDTAVMGAARSRGAVITELRDPPITVEQSRGRVTVHEQSRR
jgi:hypothetical protein